MTTRRLQQGGRVEVERPDRPDGSEAVAPEALSPAQRQALAALDELRSMKLTKEEEEALDGFETFRREHPILASSCEDRPRR